MFKYSEHICFAKQAIFVVLWYLSIEECDVCRVTQVRNHLYSLFFDSDMKYLCYGLLQNVIY